MKTGKKTQEINQIKMGFADFTPLSLSSIFDASKQRFHKIFEVTEDDYADLRKEWEKFYEDHFGLSTDFSRVIIPPKPETGSWRLLVIAQGMTNNKMFARMNQLFKCWKYTDHLDVALLKNARTTENSYAVLVRNGIEPDAEFLGKSVLEADYDMGISMTLLERLTFEVKYFSETGTHLDVEGGTMCLRSSNSGSVPSVYFDSKHREVHVRWVDVEYMHRTWGIRRVVSA